MIHMREAMVEQASSLSKWLLASLLAINGAGVIAILNGIDKFALPQWPASCFLVGLLLSLLGAWFNQKSNIQELVTVNTRIGYWLEVSQNGERVKETENKHAEDAICLKRRARWGPLSGFASSACFTIGALLTFVSAYYHTVDRHKICSSIESDMLSEVPERQNGIALYQALGCKPK